jgi:uncharacterized repeat protein (TIGR03843 family)
LFPSDPAVDELLSQGSIEVEGRLVDASNATLFCEISGGDAVAQCVYKPVSGERALWDFPDGTLAGREVGAYLVSKSAGLHLIPPTVLRPGPFGPGMVQLWVDTKEGDDLVDVLAPDDVPKGWRRVLRAHDRFGEPAVLAHTDHQSVRLMAALDVVINNADRKGGHVLHGTDGNVYGVDHGICLHSEHKLRTVLWGWAGEALTEDVLDMLDKLRAELDGSLGESLSEHLTRGEIRALKRRIEEFRHKAEFPVPDADYRAIPWPAF